MENATKAILIAAGVIFAVIIFTMVFFMYNQVSNYYQTKESNLSQEQLAAFNNEYVVYERELTGFELVTLINKAVDFNQTKVYGISRTEAEREERADDGYAPMSVTVTLTNLPNKKLLDTKLYTYDGNNEDTKNQILFQKIKQMQELESKINAGDLTKLASHSTDLKGLNANEFKEQIKKYTGREYNISINQILEYEDYLAFKRGTYSFEKVGMNGDQINSLEYKQTK